MSTTVNKTLTTVENIFKSLVWDQALKVAVADYPFLGVWPFSAMVNTLSDYIFSGVVLMVDVTAIKMLNDQHQAAYSKASVALALIAQNKGINSKEFQDARNTAIDAMSTFTRINQ